MNYRKSTGSHLAGAAVAQELGDQLIAANQGSAVDPRTGDRWTWGQLVIKLLNAATDYRKARDNFEARGLIAEAEDAEQSRARVMAVYDRLAELYREWPELGLDEQGRLSGVPAVLLSIAGIVGGAAIWWWAVGQAMQAARLLVLSRKADSSCDEDPTSEACRQAREDVRQAEKTIRESGVTVSGAGLGIGGLAIGALGLFALSRM